MPQNAAECPTVAIVPPLLRERRSSVSAHARLRSDTSGPSHSTALDAEQIYVLLTTYIAGATISWQGLIQTPTWTEPESESKGDGYIRCTSWRLYRDDDDSRNQREQNIKVTTLMRSDYDRLWHKNLAQSDDHDQPVPWLGRQNVLVTWPPWKSRPNPILIRKGS